MYILSCGGNHLGFAVVNISWSSDRQIKLKRCTVSYQEHFYKATIPLYMWLLRRREMNC
jgi:hypothetical protein